MEKQNNIKIRVGSIVKTKVGVLDNITMERRIRIISEDMVGCVESVVGKNNCLLQLQNGHKKWIGSSLLVFLSLKEEVEMGEPLYHSL